MKAVAIILAAGESRHMGHSKALIEHEGGRSFLQSLASTFGKAGCETLAVLGHDADAVRAQHPAVHGVTNERWRDSHVSSVKVGLQEALSEEADLVLLHPVDMPAVRVNTLKSLLKAVGDSVEGLRPEFDGAPGFPIVLSRAAAQRLVESGASGLEEAVKGLNLRRVAVKDPGVIVNINTPAAYERVFGSAPKLAPPPKRRGKRAESGESAPAPEPLDSAADGLSGP